MFAKRTKYQHIIWDWNGTLLDDAYLCVEIINEMLRRRNKPQVTHEKYKKEFGFPVSELYVKLGFDTHGESVETLASEFVSEYDRRCHECKLQSGAFRALESWAAMGATQSILSACQQVRLEEGVDVRMQRAQVLLVGDTIHDFEVAEAVGVDCFLIPSGYSTRKRLESCQTTVLDSLDRLFDTMLQKTVR
jgi:phosphoglycolate phosphatase